MTRTHGSSPIRPWLALGVASALIGAACTADDRVDADPDAEDRADDDPVEDGPVDEAPEDEQPADEPEGPVDATDPEDDTGQGGEAAQQRLAAELSTPRTEVTGTVWEGRVIAVGGLDAGGRAVADVDLYDPRTDTWESGPDLPVALHHTAVETLGDRVYVVGGYSIREGGWMAESDVWSLGPGEGTWREEASLGTARGALAVASTGQHLVAIGGVDAEQQVLTSTERLGTDADAWEPGPDLATPREHLDATAIGDEVYAIAGRVGGFDTNHASVEVLRGGAWEAAPPLQSSRGGIGADTLDGTPCVAGGEEPGATIGSIECLVDDAWQAVGELAVARHGLVVAAIDAELHVIGGGPEPGLTVSAVHEVIPIDVP